MLEQSRPGKELNNTENKGDDVLYKLPNIELLNDKQWRFVKHHYRLSPRELQVAKHVCRGFPNEEVARRLKIRVGTVKTHLRNIYRRIHVSSKLGMLLTFVERVAAFCDEKEIPRRITVINGRQVGTEIEPSDVTGT